MSVDETKTISRVDSGAIGFKLKGSYSEAHITLMNNVENKDIIKSVRQLQLVNKIKLSNTEFSPASSKLFHRKERGDLLLGWRGKSVILCCLVYMV